MLINSLEKMWLTDGWRLEQILNWLILGFREGGSWNQSKPFPPLSFTSPIPPGPPYFSQVYIQHSWPLLPPMLGGHSLWPSVTPSPPSPDLLFATYFSRPPNAVHWMGAFPSTKIRWHRIWIRIHGYRYIINFEKVFKNIFSGKPYSFK